MVLTAVLANTRIVGSAAGEWSQAGMSALGLQQGTGELPARISRVTKVYWGLWCQPTSPALRPTFARPVPWFALADSQVGRSKAHRGRRWWSIAVLGPARRRGLGGFESLEMGVAAAAPRGGQGLPCRAVNLTNGKSDIGPISVRGKLMAREPPKTLDQVFYVVS